MKSIRIAGFCLVAMLVVSMAAAGTASAAPVWEQCSEGGSTTKYKEHQCLAASSGSENWQWNEITNSEEVRIKGSLRLTDIGVPIVKKVSVECSGEAVGFVGPGIHGRITEVKVSIAQCRNIENCEEVKKIEAKHLAWQTENAEAAGKPITILTAVNKGAGNEPGWAVECKVLGIAKEDVCEAEAGKPESLELRNIATIKGTKTELLVLATFQKLHKAKCTIGGAETGEVSGSLAILKANEWGLRVKGG